MATQRILTVSQIAALAALFERASSASEAQYIQILGDLAGILDHIDQPKRRHADMGMAEFLDAAAARIPAIMSDNIAQLQTFPTAADRFAKAMQGVTAQVTTALESAAPAMPSNLRRLPLPSKKPRR